MNQDNLLENFFVAAIPGGIEAQEARGQKDFVNSETLPIDCPKEELEKIGFKFGENADDLFVNVEMPNGWKKVPTDHSMWSELYDEKNRKRASIFYKAAFYDRSAHMDLCNRYSYGYVPEDNYESDLSYEDRKKGNWYGQVADCGKIIFRTKPITNPTHEQTDKLNNMGREWLEKHYSNYNDVLAYWD